VSSVVSPRSADEGLWKEGLRAFEEKEYGRAATAFERLVQSSRDEELCRRATFALACTRLVLARDRDNLYEAMDLWYFWAGMSSSEPGDEDARMMTPFLTQIAPFVSYDSQGATGVQPLSAGGELPQGDEVVKEREIRRLRTRLEGKEEEIRGLRSQIQSLKHQIDSLEMISREIQQKKKEISSP